MTASFRSKKIVPDFEAETFLQFDCGGLETLNNFPNVKQLFLKGNTPLPSTAAVERLFSAGSLVISAQYFVIDLHPCKTYCLTNH